MDAGFLDMLEHARDHHLIAVAQRVDVDLDCVAQILVDQDGRVARHLHCGLNVIVELLVAVHDLHRAPAEHVARTHQHRIADTVRDRDRLVAAARDAVGGLQELELVDERREAFAILG